MTEQQFNTITPWQKETFPKATPVSKLHHLQKEIPELINELIKGNGNSYIVDEGTANEYADCFFLLFGSAAAAGMSYQDIIKAIDQKFEINKNRQWGKPDANGVVEHIR